MPEPPPIPGPRRELARDLTVSHAGAVVVGTIIGSGIFLVPAEMMQAAGSSELVYLAWIVGGLLSMFGALTYSELAAMKPQAGGEYVYMRDGYGPLGGFLYAWTYFVIAKPGSMASIVTGFVRILSNLNALQFLGEARPDGWHPTLPGQAVAIAAIVAISLINYIGVKRAGEFQLFFTLLKVALILAIVAMGFAYAKGSLANLATHYSLARGGMAGFMAALLASLWAYDGWNLVTTVSAEIRDPQRSLPRALIAGVATVAGLYILVNAAVQYVLPAEVIARSSSPALDAIRWAGHGILTMVLIAMALAMLATLNGSTMTGARVPFALSRDGYFFSGLAKVHARFRTPSTSIAVQAALAIGLLLFAGSFQQLFALTLFAEWLFYLLVTTTVFIFRRREPDAIRPYRVWGYPVVPALFVVASAALLCFTFAANVKNSLLGSVLILAGIPVYFLFARRRAKQNTI
ncbi:MAG TPA: amino acid permease [Terriglobales bacterium]|jgi:basic amino acid/polyamine antiporter, APA family|nr:amino acid permease [Terriglobales bacterium]